VNPKRRIQIVPVMMRTGRPVTLTPDGAAIFNRKGEASWECSLREVTGKGIFVAACARSGTLYITKVLRALGYNIGHEIFDTDGSVGYHLAVIKPDRCLHQVRHPLKQISSMFDHQAWGFMDYAAKITSHSLLGCMQYWLQWNELLEEFCVWRYQLEQFDSVWNEFLDRIDHPYEPLPDVSRSINSRHANSALKLLREIHNFDWTDLFECDDELAYKILLKAEQYGYAVPIPGELETAQVAQA